MGSWNYAELSKAAKAAGGPEKYIELLEQASRQKGKEEMLPWLVIAVVGTFLFTAGTIKIVNILKIHKDKNKETIEEIKRELIDGIKEYDAINHEVIGGGEENADVSILR